MPPRMQRDRSVSLRIMLVANTGWNILRFRLPLVEALVERDHEVTVVADFRPEQLMEARRPGVHPFALPIDAMSSSRLPAVALRSFSHVLCTLPENQIRLTRWSSDRPFTTRCS